MPETELTDDEKAIFNAEWSLLLTRHFRYREVMDIFEDHRDSIFEAAKIAKYELDAGFGGANARTNEFGWMPIMPQHLRSLSTAPPSTYEHVSWDRYITTTDVNSTSPLAGVGWKWWLPSAEGNVKLSKYCTMVVVGFADPVPVPKVDAILAKIKSVDYPIWYFGDRLAETDYHVFELTEPFVVEKEQEFYLQTHCCSAGLDKLRPLGIMYAKGDYMRDKDAYLKV
ncbi:MAG: hypothetical protein GWP10_10075 [Nitrospiraceae bacterium]|nr:hypothetical protein [Nitrospiraceae bacterium]